MRIAGILSCSLVNGYGVRYVIFCQGCDHHCEGCHNPDTWDLNGGSFVTPAFRRSFTSSQPLIN